MIVAASIRLVIDQLRIYGHSCHGRTVNQGERRVVLVEQIVRINIVGADSTVLLDSDAAVVNDNVICHHRVVVSHATRSVASAYDNAATDARTSVIEKRVPGYGHIIRRMPQGNSPRRGTVDDVVVDVPAQIRLINALGRVAAARSRADVMHDIANHIVIAGAVISVIDASSAVAGAWGRNVMNIVADGPHEGALIQYAEASVAADVKADNVYVIAGVVPHLLYAARTDERPPLCFGDKSYPRRGSAARAGGNSSVGSRQHVYHISGLGHRSCVVDG